MAPSRARHLSCRPVSLYAATPNPRLRAALTLSPGLQVTLLVDTPRTSGAKPTATVWLTSFCCGASLRPAASKNFYLCAACRRLTEVPGNATQAWGLTSGEEHFYRGFVGVAGTLAARLNAVLYTENLQAFVATWTERASSFPKHSIFLDEEQLLEAWEDHCRSWPSRVA